MKPIPRAQATPRIERLAKAAETLADKPVINLAELAAACGDSDAAVRKELNADPNFPIVQRGSKGVDHQFDTKATLAYLVAKDTARVAAQQAQNARMFELSGITTESADLGAMSFEQISKQVALTLQVDQAAERRGRFCDAASVLEFMVGYNEAVTTGIMSAVRQIDPTNILEPEIRIRIETELRQVALAAHRAANEFIEGKNETIRPRGVAPTR